MPEIILKFDWTPNSKIEVTRHDGESIRVIEAEVDGYFVAAKPHMLNVIKVAFEQICCEMMDDMPK